MSTAHLICGYNAAGKTTLALRLAEDSPAVRYSLDELMIASAPHLDYAEDAYADLVVGGRESLWREAAATLAAGTDVVLDWNCWRAADRALWADRARSGGHAVVVHWVDVPLAVALERSRARNTVGATTSHRLRDEDVRALARLFEEPRAAEGFEIVRHPA